MFLRSFQTSKQARNSRHPLTHAGAAMSSTLVLLSVTRWFGRIITASLLIVIVLIAITMLGMIMMVGLAEAFALRAELAVARDPASPARGMDDQWHQSIRLGRAHPLQELWRYRYDYGQIQLRSARGHCLVP